MANADSSRKTNVVLLLTDVLHASQLIITVKKICKLLHRLQINKLADPNDVFPEMAKRLLGIYGQNISNNKIGCTMYGVGKVSQLFMVGFARDQTSHFLANASKLKSRA